MVKGLSLCSAVLEMQGVPEGAGVRLAIVRRASQGGGLSWKEEKAPWDQHRVVGKEVNRVSPQELLG